MKRLLWFWRTGGRDLRLLLLALKHPNRPVWLLPSLAALVIYAIEPLNFAIPLLGLVDDVVLLPMLLHWLVRMLPPETVQPPGSRPGRRPPQRPLLDK